jgi:hypothetical protein
MDADFSEVEIGIVVNLQTLREVLKELSFDGMRWWIASDPHDSAETGFVTIGHGDPRCVDRLNTLYYRAPVVGNEKWKERTDRLIVMVDPSTANAEEPGYYLEDGRVVEDPLEDFISFYEPIERALIARLQTRN